MKFYLGIVLTLVTVEMFHFRHFPSIFVLLKLTSLVTLFFVTKNSILPTVHHINYFFAIQCGFDMKDKLDFTDAGWQTIKETFAKLYPRCLKITEKVSFQPKKPKACS